MGAPGASPANGCGARLNAPRPADVLPKGSMYYYGNHLGLKGVTISWLWGICIYYSGTWTLWVGERKTPPSVARAINTLFIGAQIQEPAPPNYPLRHPKYHLIDTIRPLNIGGSRNVGDLYLALAAGAGPRRGPTPRGSRSGCPGSARIDPCVHIEAPVNITRKPKGHPSCARMLVRRAHDMTPIHVNWHVHIDYQ